MVTSRVMVCCGCGLSEWAWSDGCGLLILGVVCGEWVWPFRQLACGLSQAMGRKVAVMRGRGQYDGRGDGLWAGLPGGAGLLTVSSHAHAMQQHQVLVGHLAHETRSFQEGLSEARGRQECGWLLPARPRPRPRPRSPQGLLLTHTPLDETLLQCWVCI